MRRSGLALGMLLSGLAWAGPLPTVFAQSADDSHEGAILDYDTTNEIYRFRWWGREGRTYFLQHSENLADWLWVPLVETGNDSVREWGFTSTGDRFFLRLKHTDVPTVDAANDDFDGDGVSNLAEVQQGTNPFLSMDSDNDGLSNDREAAIGSDPNDALSGLDERLVGRWQFNDGAGSAFVDSSAAGRDGVLSGAFTWGASPSGRDFIALNDQQAKGTIPAADLLLGAGNANFTVAFWVKVLEQPSNQWRVLARKGENDLERTFALWLIPNSMKIHARISGTQDPNMGIGSSVRSLPINEWAHVAYVKSGDKLRLFINGQLDSQVTLPWPTVGNTGSIRLGNHVHDGTVAAYDLLEVYDLALTDGEIANLCFATAADGDADGLPDWWEISQFGNLIGGKLDDLNKNGRTEITDLSTAWLISDNILSETGAEMIIFTPLR